MHTLLCRANDAHARYLIALARRLYVTTCERRPLTLCGDSIPASDPSYVHVALGQMTALAGMLADNLEKRLPEVTA